MTDTVSSKRSFKDKRLNVETERKKVSYPNALRKAYYVGYRAGYSAHSDIPNRFGSRAFAVNGFSKGLNTARKLNKYVYK